MAWSFRSITTTDPQTGEKRTTAPVNSGNPFTDIRAAQAQQNPGAYLDRNGMAAAEEIAMYAPELGAMVAMRKSLGEQRQRVRRQSRTILTGGQGLMTPAPTAKRQLLG